MSLQKKLKKLWNSPRAFFGDAYLKRFGVSYGRKKVEGPEISLVVPVFGDGPDLTAFVTTTLVRAGGARANIELVLFVHETDIAGQRAIEGIGKMARQVTVVKYADEEVHDAIDEMMPRFHGAWIGFSSVNASYAPDFFVHLRRELKREFETSALVTEVNFQAGPQSKLFNDNFKAKKHIQLLTTKNVPFIDVENVFLPKSVVCDFLLRQRNAGGKARGLSYLYSYFQSLGACTVKVVPTLVKQISVNSSTPYPYGLCADGDSRRAIESLLYFEMLVRDEEQIPDWMQIRLVFALFSLFDLQMMKRNVFDGLNDEHLARLDERFKALMRLVSFDLIERARADIAKWAVRYSVYYRYLGICPLVAPVHLEVFDVSGGMARFRFRSPFPMELTITKNGMDYAPPYEKVIEQKLGGSTLIIEKIMWVSVLALNELVFRANGRLCLIYSKGKRIPRVSGAMFERFFPRPRVRFTEAPGAWILRRLASSALVSGKYRGGWLFLDKDVRADDNAEHYYRWVMNNAPEKAKSYFIISRQSRDWSRLKREGFQLIPFGSLQHKLALLNAAWIFSSHAAPFVINYLPKKHYSDLLNFKFCFLQHGVIKDDLSTWANNLHIDMFVTSSEGEYASVSGGYYKFTSREVALTGLPRYDSLYARKAANPKRILVMPTWRLSLTGQLIGKSSVRELNPDFGDSEYCLQWGNFLSNAELMDKLAAAGYEVVFLPHPNVQPYLSLFHVAPSVTVADLSTCSVQDYLADCALLITDYSSVSFDIGYLRRPVLYFQFDLEQFYASHTYRRGYYDCEIDGFGPVVFTIAELNATMEKMLKKDFALEPEYRARIERFFCFNDAENSRRVYLEALKRSPSSISG